MMRYNVRLVAISASIMALATPFDPGSVRADEEEMVCETTVSFLNYRRRVPGPVNAECGGLHDWCDRGWGNWGVDSNRGARYNGTQFAGWPPPWSIGQVLCVIPIFLSGPDLQWQSCTREHPAPDPRFYNDRNYTTQKADPDDARWYAGYSRRGPIGVTCATRASGVSTFRNLYMSMVELDSPDGNEWVGTLRYDTVHVPVTCSHDWDCAGESQWSEPNGSSSTNVSANIQVQVRMEASPLNCDEGSTDPPCDLPEP